MRCVLFASLSPEPVYNVSVRFNNNNSIIADTKVYLHICANGRYPHTRCV